MYPSGKHRQVVALSKAPSHRVVASGVCVHLAVVLSMQQSAVNWRSADPTWLNSVLNCFVWLRLDFSGGIFTLPLPSDLLQIFTFSVLVVVLSV